MRSASSERKRPWGAPLPRREPKQAIKLTVPSITSSDLSLSSLHTKLATLANKVTEFVSASLDALAGGRTTSTAQQDRLLEELQQEKEKWEHHVFYALTLEEDALQHSGLETASCDLGSAVGDFKRVSQLVAEAQNQVTLAVRRAARRDDAGLNSRLWQVFTGLNQSIYEAFFRRRRTEAPEDPRVRQLEARLAEYQEALRAKDSEVQNMERRLARDRELFTKVEYAAQLESDLRSAEDLTRKLRADLAARDLALKDLERRVRSSEGSPRFKTKEEPRFTEKRPNSALREPVVSWKELEIELQREREKSRSFFNALKRKEKECDELYESLGTKALEEVDGLKREVEELTKALSEARRTEQRQTSEMSQLATLVKSLEREKTRLESEKSLIGVAKDSTLQGQLDEQVQANEDLRKQLKLVLEDKQKLLRILSQTKAELSRTADGYSRIERERDLLEQKGQALVQEKDILLRQLAKQDLRKAESLVIQVQARLDVQLKSISERLLQREERLEQVESQCKEGLQHYDAMLREANDRTAEQLGLAEARVQAKQTEMETLARSLSQAQGEIRLWQAQYSDLDQKSKELVSSLRLKSKEEEVTIQQLRYERKILESDNASLKQELRFVEDEMQSLQSVQVENSREVASSLEEIQLRDHNHKAETEDLQLKWSTQTELNQRLRQEINDLQWHLDQAETNNKVLEGQIQTLQSQKSEDANLAEVTMLLQEAQNQLIVKQRQLEETHSLHSKPSDIQELEQELKTLREEKTEMELQLDDAFARLQDNEQFRNQAEERLCELQEDHRKGLAELAAVQKQLRELQEKKTESEAAPYRDELQLGSSVDTQMRELIAKSIEALQAQEGKLKQEITTLNLQLTATSAENKRLKVENLDLLDQTRTYTQTITGLKGELEEVQKQHKGSLKRIRMELTEDIKGKEAELATLREEMQDQRAKAEKEVKELVSKSLAALQGQEAQLQRDLKETKSVLSELSAENYRNIKEIEDLRTAKTQLLGQIESFEAGLEDKNRKIAELTLQIHTSETASDQKVKELISKSLAALQGQEAKLRKELEALEGQLGTVTAENKQLTRHNVDLQEQVRASALAITAAKEELEEGRKQHSLSVQRAKARYLADCEAKDAEIASLKENAQSVLQTTEREKRELVTKSIAALQGQEAQLRQELVTTQERNSALSRERDLAVTEAEDLKRRIEQQQSDLETLLRKHDGEMQGKQEEIMTLVAKSIEALQGQESKLKLEIGRLEEQLSAVTAENSSLRVDIAGLQDQTRASVLTVTALREELAEAHKQHNASLKRIRAEFTSEGEVKSEEIAALKDQIRTIQENKERERLELISKSIEALQGQEASFKQQITSLNAQLEASASEMAHMTSVREPSIVLEHTIDTTIISLEPALDSPSSQLTALRDAYSSLEAEHSSLQQQYIDLKDTCDKQKNQVQHLTALLKQAKETSHKLKGSSDSSREHRRFEDLNAHLAELSSQKEELEGALVAALRERERRKGEMTGIVEVWRQAGDDYKAMTERQWELMQEKLKRLDERLREVGLRSLGSCRRACISPNKQLSSGRESPDLTHTLQLIEEMMTEQMQRMSQRLQKVEARASALIAKSLVFAEGLLLSREQTRSHIQAAFEKTGFQIGEQAQLIEGQFAHIDTRASGLISKQLALVSQFADYREKLVVTLRKEAASFNATLSAAAGTVEARLEDVDKRTSALISRQIGRLAGLVERGKQVKSRGNASVQVLAEGLEAFNIAMIHTSESLEKRLEAIDAKASTLLSKAIQHISTLIGEKTNLLSSAVTIQSEVTTAYAALDQVSARANSSLEALDRKASALFVNILRRVATFSSRKAAAETAVRDLLLSCSVPALEVAVDKANRLDTRLTGLCSKVTTQFLHLKAENSRLRSLLVAKNKENEKEIASLREETAIRISQIQAESDFKLQRLRKAQISQELDTFALVDLREETLARTESAFRLIEERVVQTEMRLRAVQRVWTKGQKGWKEGFARRILGTLATLTAKLSASVAFRLQNMDKRLFEARDKVQTYSQSQQSVPSLSQSISKPAASNEPIKISLHLDDSLEFTPLEPSHRRGSSVNTSLEDIKQAMGNMRVCRKLDCEGQVWVLTATLTEEPEYYWWKEQDLPSSDLLQGETMEEEMRKELAIVKSANMEALGELQRAKADLEIVTSWLSKQGYDLKRHSLEAALAEATKPSFRPLLSPISAEGSVEVTFVHEGESSQTPKMGRDAIIIPAPLDSELDGLLDTIQQQEAEKALLLQQNEAQSETLQLLQGALTKAVATLQDSPVLPHDSKGAEVLRQLLTLLSRPVWKPN